MAILKKDDIERPGLLVDTSDALLPGAMENNAQTMDEQSPAFFSEALPAAFRLDNEVVSLAVSESIQHFGDLYDPEYYASDDLGEFAGTVHEPTLLGAKNPRHMQAIKNDIQREEADRQLLGRSDSELFARMAAGVMSPLTLLPGAAIVKGAKGINVAKSVVKGGAVGTVAIGASEAALQATQQTRSFEESAYAVAGGAVLGGLLGGASARLTQGQFDKVARKLNDDLAKQVEELDELPLDAQGRSVGAAQVNKLTSEDLQIRGSGAQVLSRAVRPMIPFARLMNNPSTEVRKVYSQMAEIPMQLGAAANGKTLEVAAETELNILRNRQVGESYIAIRDEFAAYKKAEKAAGRRPATQKEFRERIAYAMRNNDLDDLGDEFVTNAARRIRTAVFEPLLKDAQELGLLPTDVQPRLAKSYLTRMWSKQKIIGNEPEFMSMARTWAAGKVAQHVNGVNARIRELEAELAQADAARSATQASDVQRLRETVSSLTQEIDSLRAADREAAAQIKIDTGRANALRSELREATEESAKRSIREQIKVFEAAKKSAAKLREENKARASGLVKQKNKALRDQKKAEETASAAAGSGRRNPAAIRDEIANLELDKRVIQDATGDTYNDYVDEVAQGLFSRMSGAGDNEVPDFIAPVSRGPLKEKLLDIEDNVAAPFLENDVNIIIDYYNRSMGAQVAFQRRFGSITLDRQFASIDDEFDQLIRLAETDKERAALVRSRDSAKSDLRDIRDLQLGTYKRAKDPDGFLAQASTVIRDVTYMAYLGGVTISSLPDVFRNTMVHGFGNAFGDLAAKVSAPKGWRQMQLDDLKQAGFGFEAVLSSRMSTLADITDPYARGSALTRFTGTMSAGFSRLTLINHWNDMMKNWAATTTQMRILRDVDELAAGKISKKEQEYLTFMGIDDSTASIIRQQYRKHGEKRGKGYLSGIRNWDYADPNVRNAAKVYNAALRREADTIIVTKSVGDTPLLANSPAGALALQFKSFLFGANQRVLMRGLSDGDSTALVGATLMIGAGMLTSAIKQMERELAAEATGRKPGQSIDDWETDKWIAEGLDRSGLLSIVWEANNMWEKAGGYGMTRALGAAPASRYASRNLLGSFIPAASYMETAATSSIRMANAAVLGDDIYKADVNNFRRSIPFQNLIGFRFLFDQVQGDANKWLDAK